MINHPGQGVEEEEESGAGGRKRERRKAEERARWGSNLRPTY